MQKNLLYIKNVVCQRCILTVQSILDRLEIPYEEVSLGEVVLKEPISAPKLEELQDEFKKVGFEILVDKNARIVNQIKSIIIEGIYGGGNFSNKKLSQVLAEQLHYDYSHLTNIFSKYEGKSIQQFQLEIKMERVKELLQYEELNIAQIAADLNYSSAAYLTTQFKKATGMNPSQYKLLHEKGKDAPENGRASLDVY